jgi:hypothetical protein
MGEGLADQVGVDQRGDDADLREAEPMDHELRSILHQERDHVTLAKVL